MKIDLSMLLHAVVLQSRAACATGKRILCATLLIPLFVLAAHATPITTKARSGFSLTFPDDSFALVDPTPGGVDLALRHLGVYAFPTLNVIVRPGSWDPTRVSALQEGEGVVASYRKLGLTDARLLSSRTTTISGTVAAAFTIAYDSQGESFRAQVFLIPGADRHFIATILARDGQDDAAEALLVSTLESGFHMQVESEVAATPLNAPPTWLWVLFIIGATTVGRRWWKRHRSLTT